MVPFSRYSPCSSREPEPGLSGLEKEVRDNAGLTVIRDRGSETNVDRIRLVPAQLLTEIRRLKTDSRVEVVQRHQIAFEQLVVQIVLDLSNSLDRGMEIATTVPVIEQDIP